MLPHPTQNVYVLWLSNLMYEYSIGMYPVLDCSIGIYPVASVYQATQCNECISHTKVLTHNSHNVAILQWIV